MAPPINVQDWYGDRHTCQIASGALACTVSARWDWQASSNDVLDLSLPGETGRLRGMTFLHCLCQVRLTGLAERCSWPVSARWDWQDSRNDVLDLSLPDKTGRSGRQVDLLTCLCQVRLTGLEERYSWLVSARWDWQASKNDVLDLSLPGETGRPRGWPVLCLYSFVGYRTCEHDILKTNELILMPNGTSGKRHETIDQGHTRPKIDLEARWKHYSQPVLVA